MATIHERYEAALCRLDALPNDDHEAIGKASEACSEIYDEMTDAEREEWERSWSRLALTPERKGDGTRTS